MKLPFNINIIVAINKFGFIGNKNLMMWHSPSDFKKFKQLTTGNTVVMGKNTYESIGKPLPNRKNIVISSQLKDERVSIINHLDELGSISPVGEVFIIGGENLFKIFVEKAENLYITTIDNDDIGDTKFEFPKINFTLKNKEQLEDGMGTFYHFIKP